MTYEGFRLKVSKYWRKGLAKERQKSYWVKILLLFPITVGAG